MSQLAINKLITKLYNKLEFKGWLKRKKKQCYLHKIIFNKTLKS